MGTAILTDLTRRFDFHKPCIVRVAHEFIGSLLNADANDAIDSLAKSGETVEESLATSIAQATELQPNRG